MAHLMRRAGFGAGRDELETRVAKGYEATVEEFCFPTAVDFDPATDRIIVADSQRNRLQIYRKVRDHVDFQANLWRRREQRTVRDDA